MTQTPCRHHYDVDPPKGQTSRGVCRFCKAERVFQNFVGKERDDLAREVKQKAKRDARSKEART